MKKYLIYTIPAVIAAVFLVKSIDTTWSQNQNTDKNTVEVTANAQYTFPEFYRGIYLTSESGKNTEKLKVFIEKARAAHINTFVIDIQDSRNKACIIPPENVQLCLKNGIHPVARLVVFADGLKKFPQSAEDLEKKFKLAESACQAGFREVQFDYIRFNDYGILRHLTYQQKYDFIEGFLSQARERLKKYNARTQADIFGRIPLNTKDEIGQRMEGLDKVVDVICPMAYPSHYTWSKKLMADPYHTVYITSSKARERVKSAQIISYIQAFKMKVGATNLSYHKYIEVQIKAVHDAGIRGFYLWNARQDYEIPFEVTRYFYDKGMDKASRSASADRKPDSSVQ
jgi:hypothetical protein